jgi:tetrahydromethanopterin S-methyltransferase subunit G
VDYYNYMLQNEMERVESIEDAIEADSAEVEQQVEKEIDWENIPWENF